jgi:hypothetical protein
MNEKRTTNRNGLRKVRFWISKIRNGTVAQNDPEARKFFGAAAIQRCSPLELSTILGAYEIIYSSDRRLRLLLTAATSPVFDDLQTADLSDEQKKTIHEMSLIDSKTIERIRERAEKTLERSRRR